MENAAVQNTIMRSVPGGVIGSSQQETPIDGAGFASFLVTERQRVDQASSHSESPSTAVSQDGPSSQQLNGTGPDTSSATPNPEGQKTKDANSSLPSDSELVIEQASVNVNIISPQMVGIVEYFTNQPISQGQVIPDDSVMTDAPGTGSTVINMPGYSLTPVDTGASQIPAANPQMLAVGGVQENVAILNQPTGEPIVQTAIIGQPAPQNLTTQPNVVPGSDASESVIPQTAATTEIPGIAQQAPPVDLATQNLSLTESNVDKPSSPNVTQWTATAGVTDDATGTPLAPNIAPQAADTQAGVPIPQTLAAPASDVAAVTVANQQLPAEPSMSNAAPAEKLADHMAQALPNTPQVKEGNTINLNRTVDVQQIATRADNVENASVKISASPATVVILDKGVGVEVEAHGNEQLPNASNDAARPQAEPTPVMVKNIEIAGKPSQEVMPIVESAEAGAAKDIPAPRQYVQEAQIPSDQINRQQMATTEMPAAVNTGPEVYGRSVAADQKPEVSGDIPVQRQDTPQTPQQSTIAYRPRVTTSDQVSIQQNAPTETPIAENTVSETYGEAATIEQKLPASEDILARQNMPETQKQSPAISRPRAASGQTVARQDPQAMNSAPIPDTPQKEAPVTVNAEALGGTERAQETWRSNTVAARPDTVRNIENGESNRETSVQYVQGAAEMQSLGSDERETSGGNTPQSAEELINNIINPRTPAFDGSQFMIPRMNADSIPLNLETVIGESTANAETQMTATLPELPDRISTYVNSMDVRNGDGSISIQLEPKNLGKIRFRVSLKDNKISAELSVSLLQTKAIIELQLPEIRRSLAQQAIEVTELSVTLESGSLDSDTRHPNLFREHSNSFKQTSPSAFYDQEEELGEFLQSDARSNALVDLLI